MDYLLTFAYRSDSRQRTTSTIFPSQSKLNKDLIYEIDRYIDEKYQTRNYALINIIPLNEQQCTPADPAQSTHCCDSLETSKRAEEQYTPSSALSDQLQALTAENQRLKQLVKKLTRKFALLRERSGTNNF